MNPAITPVAVASAAWMHIEPGKITVREGYGAAPLVIWRDGEMTADAAVQGIDTIP